MSAPKVTRDCARFAPMLTARDGELDGSDRAARDAHLVGCAFCRATAADLAVAEGLVRDALLAEAAHRDFAPFVDGVMARVERKSAPSRRAAEADSRGFLAGLTAWVRQHRLAAATGAIAPAVAGIALIMYVASDRPAAPQVGDVVVVADLETTVLQTVDGPVVLLGSDDGGT